jgi:hypothetical protein
MVAQGDSSIFTTEGPSAERLWGKMGYQCLLACHMAEAAAAAAMPARPLRLCLAEMEGSTALAEAEAALDKDLIAARVELAHKALLL